MQLAIRKGARCHLSRRWVCPSHLVLVRSVFPGLPCSRCLSKVCLNQTSLGERAGTQQRPGMLMERVRAVLPVGGAGEEGDRKRDRLSVHQEL